MGPTQGVVSVMEIIPNCAQKVRSTTPQKSKFDWRFAVAVSSGATRNGSDRCGQTANGNGRPAPVHRPPGADGSWLKEAEHSRAAEGLSRHSPIAASFVQR